MNNELTNKTVLLIAPIYFDYEKEISKELTKRGARVLFIEENIDYTNVFYKFVNKFPEPLRTNLRNKHFINKINTIDEKVDYVFCIRINFFNDYILSFLRNKFNTAKFYLYYWDSCKNLLNAEKNSEYFDCVLTFDYHDAKKNEKKGWIFRPLFFVDKYDSFQSDDGDYDFDISYTATLSRERADWCNKLKDYCNEKGLRLDVFLFSKKTIYFWNKKRYEEYTKLDSKYVSFRSLSSEELTRRIRKAKVVFDCSHSTQSGLTMRSIECIGASKKMITTNTNIKNYDFYDPNNIMVIADGSLNGIDDFCMTSSKAIYSDEIREKYSISGWVDDIFK